MTRDEAIEHVDGLLRHIRKRAKLRDHEAAHGIEDNTYEWVLENIAQGTIEPHDAAAVAARALTARDIKFSRHCA